MLAPRFEPWPSIQGQWNLSCHFNFLHSWRPTNSATTAIATQCVNNCFQFSTNLSKFWQQKSVVLFCKTNINIVVAFQLKFAIDFSDRWSHHRFMADVKKLDVGVSNIDFCVDIADVSDDDDVDVDDALSKKPSQRPLYNLMSNIKNGKLFFFSFEAVTQKFPSKIPFWIIKLEQKFLGYTN